MIPPAREQDDFDLFIKYFTPTVIINKHTE